MAAPEIAKIIGVKCEAGNIGEYITLTNVTQAQRITQKLKGTDKSSIFNPAPTYSWVVGDTIQAEIYGRINGYKRTTIKSGGTTITVLASADTTTVGVSL